MKAMIFAAGLGTRLKPLTDSRPKALVTVANKPMLEHIILKLKAAGFDEIVINVHHFANQILAFLEANNNFGITIHISDETKCLRDTGGGLEKVTQLLSASCSEAFNEACIQALEKKEEGINLNTIMREMLESLQSECYLLHNVDILSNCDLESLIYYHCHSHTDIAATLLVSKRKTSRYLLFDEDNLLCGWINKDTMETKPLDFEYEEGEYKEYAYSGIQIVSPILFRHLPKGQYSIIDFYLSMCHKINIQCYVEEGLQLIDIGKPESLEKAEEVLSTF